MTRVPHIVLDSVQDMCSRHDNWDYLVNDIPPELDSLGSGGWSIAILSGGMQICALTQYNRSKHFQLFISQHAIDRWTDHLRRGAEVIAELLGKPLYVDRL